MCLSSKNEIIGVGPAGVKKFFSKAQQIYYQNIPYNPIKLIDWLFDA